MIHLDKNSKKVLKAVISLRGPRHTPEKAIENITGISHDEQLLCLKYLESVGFLTYRRVANNSYLINLTNTGLKFRRFFWFEFLNAVLKSVVLPIVLSIITAVVTVLILKSLGLDN